MDFLKKISLPPSRSGKYWRKITVCPECGLRALYRDAHPANPCFVCGAKVVEDVGRWIQISKWWQFWKSEGYWLLRKEAKEEYETEGRNEIKKV